MTQLWPAIYGTAMAGVLARSWYANPELRLVALILTADWLASNMLRWIAPMDYRGVFVMTDIAFATTFFLAWMTYRRPWVAVMSALYSISGLVGMLAYGPGAKYSFDLALNAAFLARLAVVWITSDEPRKAQGT